METCYVVSTELIRKYIAHPVINHIYPFSYPPEVLPGAIYRFKTRLWSVGDAIDVSKKSSAYALIYKEYVLLGKNKPKERPPQF